MESNNGGILRQIEGLVIYDLVRPIYYVKYFMEDIGFSTIESRILSAITGKAREKRGQHYGVSPP